MCVLLNCNFMATLHLLSPDMLVSAFAVCSFILATTAETFAHQDEVL